MSAMSFPELRAFGDCLDRENSHKGVVVDTSKSDASFNEMIRHSQEIKERLRNDSLESERTALIQEQNQLLRRQVQNQEELNDRIIQELDSN